MPRRTVFDMGRGLPPRETYEPLASQASFVESSGREMRCGRSVRDGLLAAWDSLGVRPGAAAFQASAPDGEFVVGRDRLFEFVGEARPALRYRVRYRGGALAEIGFVIDAYTAETGVRPEHPVEPALVDLARRGERAEFEFLLRASTEVPEAEWPAVWAGARRRLGLEP